MKDTQQTAIALLTAAPSLYRSLFAGLPEAIVTTDLDRGWSPKRILAHMVDVEPVFDDRLRQMVQSDRPSFAAVDPLATLEAGDLMTRTVDELLGEFQERRSATVAWLRELSEEQLERAATLDSIGEFTVGQLMHYWPSHDLAHLRGVQRMLVGVLGHEMGPAQAFDI